MEYIYRVILNVSDNGSFQKNIFKSKVARTTAKYYIIDKNNHYTRSVHVDIDKVGKASASIGFGFCTGSAWCLEQDIDQTADVVLQLLLEKLKEGIRNMDKMLSKLEMNDPEVTERDTTEFG